MNGGANFSSVAALCFLVSKKRNPFTATVLAVGEGEDCLDSFASLYYTCTTFLFSLFLGDGSI